MKKAAKSLGYSLIELMLALAIIASILMFSIRYFSVWSMQSHEFQIRSNVNFIFNGMTNYYRMNCRQQYDPAGNVVSQGLLDPNSNNVTQPLTGPVAINIGSDLATPGLIDNWQPLNPDVQDDNSSPMSDGYFGEYIVPTLDTMNVYACVDGGYPPTCTSTAVTSVPLAPSSSSPQTAQSYVAPYISHVAVELASNLSSAEDLQMQNDLSATCSSTSPTTPCSTNPGPGNYLIWEQPVTQLVQDISSDDWMMYNQVKQFNMQYTNDGMGTLSGVTWNNSNYYLCGE